MKISTSTSFVMAATATLGLSAALPDSPDIGGVSPHSARTVQVAQFAGHSPAIRTGTNSRRSLPRRLNRRGSDASDTADAGHLNGLMQSVTGALNGLGLGLRDVHDDAAAPTTGDDKETLTARQVPQPPAAPGAAGTVTGIPGQVVGGVAQEGPYYIPSMASGYAGGMLPEGASMPQLPPDFSYPQFPGGFPDMAQGAPDAVSGNIATVAYQAPYAPVYGVPNTIGQTAGGAASGLPIGQVAGVPGQVVGGTPLSGYYGSVTGGQNPPNPVGVAGGVVGGLPAVGGTAGGIIQGVPNPISTVQGVAGGQNLPNPVGMAGGVVGGLPVVGGTAGGVIQGVPNPLSTVQGIAGGQNPVGVAGGVVGGLPVVGGTAGGVIQGAPNPLSTVQGVAGGLPLSQVTGAAGQTIGGTPAGVVVGAAQGAAGGLPSPFAAMQSVPGPVGQQVANTPAGGVSSVISPSVGVSASAPVPSTPIGMMQPYIPPAGGQASQSSGPAEKVAPSPPVSAPIRAPSGAPVRPPVSLPVSAPVAAPTRPTVHAPSPPVSAPAPPVSVPALPSAPTAPAVPAPARPSAPVPVAAPVSAPVSVPVPSAPSRSMFMRAKRALAGLSNHPAPPTSGLPMPSGFPAPSAPIPNNTPPLLQPTGVGAKNAEGTVSSIPYCDEEPSTSTTSDSMTPSATMDAAPTKSTISSRRRLFRFVREEKR